MAKRRPLSPPQRELLTDIVTKPVMYVHAYSRWAKTARALVRMGLAAEKWVEGSQIELTATAAGIRQALADDLVSRDVAIDAEIRRRRTDPEYPYTRPEPLKDYAGAAPWGAIVDGYQLADDTWHRIDKPEDINLQDFRDTHPTFSNAELDDAVRVWRESIGEMEPAPTCQYCDQQHRPGAGCNSAD